MFIFGSLEGYLEFVSILDNECDQQTDTVNSKSIHYLFIMSSYYNTNKSKN